MTVISTRISDEVKKELEWYAKKEQVGTAIALRKIMDIGLKEVRLEYALELYKKGKATTMKVAEITGLSFWDIIHIIRKRKIPLYYTGEDVEEDIKTALKL